MGRTTIRCIGWGAKLSLFNYQASRKRPDLKALDGGREKKAAGIS